jgi:hypothetical protein
MPRKHIETYFDFCSVSAANETLDLCMDSDYRNTKQNNSPEIWYDKWVRLHNNNIYEYKQRQIHTNVSPFVYCAKVLRNLRLCPANIT